MTEESTSIFDLDNAPSPVSVGDVSQLMPLATSSQEDAVKHIDNAKIFSIDPGAYKSMAPELDQKVADLGKPAQTTPGLANQMAQSTEHAAALAPDHEPLSYMEKQMKLIGDYVWKRPSIAKQIVDLANEKMDSSETWNDDKEFKLLQLNQENADLSRQNYGLDGPVLAPLAGFVAGVGRSAWEQLKEGGKTLGKVQASGFKLGGPLGSVVTIGAAFQYGSAKAMYKDLAGSTYNELSFATDEDGKPLNLDDQSKKDIARGVGVIGAVAASTIPYAIAKATPFLNNIMTPTMVRLAMRSPENALLRVALMNIGQAAAAGGTAMGVVEAARVVGEELAKTASQEGGFNQAAILNALVAAGTSLKSYKRVGEAAAIGAATTGVIAAGSTYLGRGQLKQQIESAGQFGKGVAQAVHEFKYGEDVIDVTDISKAKKLAPGQTPAAPEPTAPNPDLGPQLPHANPVQEATDILHFDQAMDNINQAAKSTNLATVSPSTLQATFKAIAETAGMPKVWIKSNDIATVAKNDPQKAQDILKTIDPSGTTARVFVGDQLQDPDVYGASAFGSAPIALDPHVYNEIRSEFPELAAHARLSPSGPSVIQAPEYLRRIDEARQIQDRIFEEAGANLPEGQAPVLSKAQQKQMQEALKGLVPIKDSKEIVDPKTARTFSLVAGENGGVDWDTNEIEEKYILSRTFPDSIKNVIAKKTAQHFDNSQLAVRKQIAMDIRDAAEHEMLQVQNVELAMANEVQRDIERKRIDNDPNFNLVDRVRRESVGNAKGNQKISDYAIDPKFLTDDLLKYKDNARLKEYGMFSKGGKKPEDAAKELGQPNADTLLSNLAKTPPRETVEAARVAAHEVDFQRQIKENSTDLAETRIVKSYSNLSTLHLEEMKVMKDTEWSAVKTGIKKIALPLPKIAELNLQARQMIAKTRVGDLDSRQYQVAERRLQREAINAILKNEVERAFLNKERAILSSELQKETLIATGRVNRLINLGKRLMTEEAQQRFKDAGPAFEKAYNEIIDVVHLNPTKKGSAVKYQGAFQKWVKKMVEEGKPNMSFPPELADVRSRFEDFTVEQAELFYDRLKQLDHLARTLNQLSSEMLKKKEAQTKEMVLSNLIGSLDDHKGSKLAPAVQNRGVFTIRESGTPYEKFEDFWNDVRYSGQMGMDKLWSPFTNMEFVIRELDGEEYGGAFQNTLMAPMKGDGIYDKERGYTLELHLSENLRHFRDKNVEAFGGQDKYKYIDAKIKIIPEFKNVASLNYGRMTTADLMIVWAYGGDPDHYVTRGRTYRDHEGNSITNEVIQSVLDRELTREDVLLAQNLVVDGYKSYHGMVQRDALERTGQRVDMIQGRTNIWRDESFPGGYMPGKYKIDFTKEAAKQTINSLRMEKQDFINGDKTQYYSRKAALEMTKQGYKEDRVGSDQPLDYSFRRALRGHEEVIIDLAYGKVVDDGLTLLRDSKLQEAIIGKVGKTKLDLMINTYIERAGRIHYENANYFSDQSRFIKDTFGHLQSNFNVAVLGLNPTSTAIQYSGFLQVIQNLGPKGHDYLTGVNRSIVANMNRFPEFYDFANKLDPTIGHFLEGIQNKIASEVFNLSPSKNEFKGLSVAKSLHEWGVATAMSPMSLVDIQLKITSAIASYRFFMDGHATNFSLETLAKMTDKERYDAAQVFVRQMSRTSLTHSREEDKALIQKNPLGGLLSNYWNDGRNVINNMVAQKRRAGWKAQKDEAGKRDVYGATKVILGMLLISMTGRYYYDYVHGNSVPTDNPKDYDPTTVAGLENLTTYMLLSPVDDALQSLPPLNSVYFAANRVTNTRHPEKKDVQLPMTKILSDLATSGNALWELLSTQKRIADLDQDQTKALLDSSAVFIFPWPANGTRKMQRIYGDYQRSKLTVDMIANLKTAAGDIQKDPPKNMSDDYKQELEALQQRLGPGKANIPEETYGVIKRIESEDNWKKINRANGASGTYQFTESQWNSIRRSAPELALTENGRVAMDQTQQEKAVKWQTERNADRLQKSGLPVDSETLYAAHAFGVEKASKLYQEAADSKVKGILVPEDYVGHEAFSKFKTVGQVRKFIKSQVRANGLTKTAQTTED